MTDSDSVTSKRLSGTLFDEPLVASFWRNGKFIKFHCLDCVVNAGPEYTEVILTTPNERDSMFIITNDPTISANMSDRVFDGFQLRSAKGEVVEMITVNDSRAVH